ncbi:MAG: hypothetical protein LBO73_01085 [Holosporaceae bacterium]|jgi:hypothetical protein|nr:hypothetical protein [Holosporaceae bacterium]
MKKMLRVIATVSLFFACEDARSDTVFDSKQVDRIQAIVKDIQSLQEEGDNIQVTLRQRTTVCTVTEKFLHNADNHTKPKELSVLCALLPFTRHLSFILFWFRHMLGKMYGSINEIMKSKQSEDISRKKSDLEEKFRHFAGNESMVILMNIKAAGIVLLKCMQNLAFPTVGVGDLQKEIRTEWKARRDKVANALSVELPKILKDIAAAAGGIQPLAQGDPLKVIFIDGLAPVLDIITLVDRYYSDPNHNPPSAQEINTLISKLSMGSAASPLGQQQAAPQQAAPQQAAPQQAAPQQAAPQQAAPQQAAPQQAAPQQAAPQQAAPQQDDSQQGDSQQGAPQQDDSQQGAPQQDDSQQGDSQ